MSKQMSTENCIIETLTAKGYTGIEVERQEDKSYEVLAKNPNDGDTLVWAGKNVGVRKWLDSVLDVSPVVVEPEMTVEEWEAQNAADLVTLENTPDEDLELLIASLEAEKDTQDVGYPEPIVVEPADVVEVAAEATIAPKEVKPVDTKDLLLQAIAERRWLMFHYTRTYEVVKNKALTVITEETDRKVAPVQAIGTQVGDVMFTGYCSLRRERRSFDLSKCSNMELGGPTPPVKEPDGKVVMYAGAYHLHKSSPRYVKPETVDYYKSLGWVLAPMATVLQFDRRL